MNFCEEVLVHLLERELRENFPQMLENAVAQIDSECCTALCKIKKIVADDNLSDQECFMRIEKIICALEDVGSNGGSRHDFG